ncbi:carboxyl transferase domain-containing protein, partial [Anaerotruncus colihominis]
PLFATNMITCFARINKRAVGIIANQPRVGAGCLDINASDKAARFIRFCDAFGLPVITLVDVPGFLPGTHQEYGGIIRHGAKMLYAYSEATVPKITLILRKAYGGAYLAMCCRELGADVSFAWPDAEIAVMGPEGAANIIFRKETPEQRAQSIAQYKAEFATPYKAAEHAFVDDVIHPAESRQKIVAALEMLHTKEQSIPKKRHGNIPL